MAKEVQARTEILDRMVAERTQQLNEKNAALQKSLSQIADELTIAQRTQLSILPSHLPSVEGLRLYAHMRAAREVGGDFYDLIELDDHRVGIVVADVSDKGVPAALMMAVSYTLIKSTALHEASPAKVLEEVNHALSEENETMMFVTAFYGIVDARTGRFTFANAGHDPPLLLRAGEPVAELKRLGGTALGILDGADYAEHSQTLQPGDTVVLYTDGVTEAFNGDCDAYSVDRLKTLLDQIRTLPVERLCTEVLDSVDAHANGTPQSDDITCVALRFGSGDVPDDDTDQSESKSDEPAKLVIDLKPSIEEITRLAETVEGFAGDNNLTEEIAGLLNLVLDEIVSNIVNYGCTEDREYHLRISIRLVGRTIEVVVEDDATPFDPLEVSSPDIEASLDDRPIGGMGLHLVRHFTDDISYEHDGKMNRLTLTKVLDR
jgi:sigma-B regulation protein RsbU (phosphoserine phosphatase)